MRPAKTCCPTSATTRRRCAQWPRAAGGDAVRRRRRHRRRAPSSAAACATPWRRRSRRPHQASPLQLHQALLHAAALHLLRFDERVERRVDGPVAENVNWLDFSHALTFGHAVRLQCTREPALWPRRAAADGALRSAATRPTSPPTTRRCRRCAAGPWPMRAAFDAACRGAGARPWPGAVHLPGAPAQDLGRGARRDRARRRRRHRPGPARRRASRLFGARFKQRHLLRTARQAAGSSPGRTELRAARGGKGQPMDDGRRRQ